MTVMESIYDSVIPEGNRKGMAFQDIIKGFMVESYLFDGRQDWSRDVRK